MQMGFCQNKERFETRGICEDCEGSMGFCSTDYVGNIRVILGFYGGNGKEDGNYYVEIYRV